MEGLLGPLQGGLGFASSPVQSQVFWNFSPSSAMFDPVPMRGHSSGDSTHSDSPLFRGCSKGW